MATAARAIQVSMVQVTIGIVVGSSIEAVMPSSSASSSTASLAFEALVQVALNAVLIGTLGSQLMVDDPTYGFLFSMSLFEAQPGLKERVSLLSSVAKLKVSQAGLQMGPHALEEAPATQRFSP